MHDSVLPEWDRRNYSASPYAYNNLMFHYSYHPCDYQRRLIVSPRRHKSTALRAYSLTHSITTSLDPAACITLSADQRRKIDGDIMLIIYQSLVFFSGMGLGFVHLELRLEDDHLQCTVTKMEEITFNILVQFTFCTTICLLSVSTIEGE